MSDKKYNRRQALKTGAKAVLGLFGVGSVVLGNTGCRTLRDIDYRLPGRVIPITTFDHELDGKREATLEQTADRFYCQIGRVPENGFLRDGEFPNAVYARYSEYEDVAKALGVNPKYNGRVIAPHKIQITTPVGEHHIFDNDTSSHIDLTYLGGGVLETAKDIVQLRRDIKDMLGQDYSVNLTTSREYPEYVNWGKIGFVDLGTGRSGVMGLPENLRWVVDNAGLAANNRYAMVSRSKGDLQFMLFETIEGVRKAPTSRKHLENRDIVFAIGTDTDFQRARRFLSALRCTSGDAAGTANAAVDVTEAIRYFDTVNFDDN